MPNGTDVSLLLEFLFVFLFLTAVLLCIGYSTNKEAHRKPRLGLAHILVAVMLSLPLTTVGILFDRVNDILTVLEDRSSTTTMRVFVALFLIVLGFAAYAWKRIHQTSYGMIEVGFGCIAVIFIALTLGHDSILSKWIGLVSGTYVIARGMNNISEATEKTQKLKTRAVAK